MAVSINWATKVIFVPKSFMTLVQSVPMEIRSLDLNAFRMALKDLEDDAEGMTFLDTHRHNTEVGLGGLTYARVIEIINGYTVTFEDGQYAVNLVGANSNVGDCVNVNQVSVRSSNSAGMTSSPAIEYASFNGGVTIDVLSPDAGTIYPVGTPQRPVNNLADAKLIASVRGFNTLFILGNLELIAGSDVGGLKLVGEGQDTTLLTLPLLGGVGTIATEMESLTLTGKCGGYLQMKDCRLDTVSNLCSLGGDAFFYDCRLKNTIQLDPASDQEFNFINCRGMGFTSFPVIDVNGCPAAIYFTNYSGKIAFTNITNVATFLTMDINSGLVLFEPSCNESYAVARVRGVGVLDDRSAGLTVDSEGLISKDLMSLAVWDEELASHVTLGSTGAELALIGFFGAVYINIMDGVSGTTFPIGTKAYPCNNFLHARIIAAAQGLNTYIICGVLEVDVDLEKVRLVGSQSVVNYSPLSDKIELNGHTFTEVSFEHITLNGSMVGINAQYYDCYFKDVDGLSGSATQCSMVGDNTIEPGMYFSAVGLILEGDFTNLDLQSTSGTIASLDIDSGYLLFKNSVDGCLIELNLRGGEIELDYTCRGGDLYAEGYGTLFDNTYEGAMNTKANHLIALETIPGPVWDEELPGEHGEGTAGEQIIAIKTLAEFLADVEGGKWKIDGDQMIFYKADNLTEVMRFDITRDSNLNPIMRARV